MAPRSIFEMGKGNSQRYISQKTKKIEFLHRSALELKTERFAKDYIILHHYKPNLSEKHCST
jgi:hypothetical protein